MEVKYFMRKKVPAYHSIEGIFSSICSYLQGRPEKGIKCELDEVPYYFSPLNFFRNILYVRRRQADVNHITGDIHYAILGCSRSRLNVLTIHDCVILTKFRQWDPRYWVFRMLWYEWPIAKADVVTVISQKTKDELLRHTRAGRNKIKVVNNFVDPVFTYVPKAFNGQVPVFLFIGSTPNKNLDRVLEAIKGMSCRLQIIGVISAGQEQLIRDNGLDVHVEHNLKREEVVDRYRNADIVLFPSLYEGFGMLIVEANAVGRPVVTSDLTPMKEVAGGSAILVDPFNTASIRAGIQQVAGDAALREALVAKGLKNVQRFQIGTIVDSYVSLYIAGIGELNIQIQ